MKQQVDSKLDFTAFFSNGEGSWLTPSLSLSPTSLPCTTGVAVEATVAWPELPASSPKVSRSLCTEDWRHCPSSSSSACGPRHRRHGGWSSPSAAARQHQQQYDVDVMEDGARQQLQPVAVNNNTTSTSRRMELASSRSPSPSTTTRR